MKAYLSVALTTFLGAGAAYWATHAVDGVSLRAALVGGVCAGLAAVAHLYQDAPR